MWKVIDLITRQVVIYHGELATNMTRDEAERVSNGYNNYLHDNLASEILPQDSLVDRGDYLVAQE